MQCMPRRTQGWSTIAYGRSPQTAWTTVALASPWVVVQGRTRARSFGGNIHEGQNSRQHAGTWALGGWRWKPWKGSGTHPTAYTFALRMNQRL